ncbi:MAG TPA: carbohydrate porin [Methylocella sp.]|nr:carbohydrate porin [Methylocella sp.]
MPWIEMVFGRRDWRGSRKRLEQLIAIGTAATAGLWVPAFAADLPAAPSPVFTWTGVYLGANVGGWFGPNNPKYEALGFSSPGFDLVPNGGGTNVGATGGFQAGYNYQMGSFVPGFEADFDYLGNCRGGTFTAPPAYALFGTHSYSLSGGCSYYAGTLRGRLGFAFDRILVYGTGGIAYGGNRNPGSVTFNSIAPGNYFEAGASAAARTKYVFGAGVEYALSDHWFARAEYLYENLGRIDQFFLNGAGQIYDSSQFNQNHIFRLGLDYRFGDGSAAAEPPSAPAGGTPPATAEEYAAHGAITWVPQGYPSFPAAYSGPQSLPPEAHLTQVLQVDAYLGLALWKGASIYFNPEVDQGFGVGDTFGVAGFPNAFVYKLGSSAPYERNQRYFLRQVIGLGGETEQIDAGPYQLAGPVDANRLTFTVGKYSVVDIFDDNKYAHDPVNTFLNWTIIDMGAFDYAGDAWGFTYGATAEWKQDSWTARAGVFQLSTVPGSAQIEPVLFRQFEPVVELEERHKILDQPGKLKFLFYANDGFMGSYNEAVAEGFATGTTPDITDVRARRVKVGGGFNLEQQITPSLGFFARLSMSTGQYETFHFTEVERSASGGFQVSGDLWGREKDQIGIGGVLNGISNAHANYLAAGGTGIILGDGALSYSGERVLETYYKYVIADGMHISLDYQFVDNPGYNLARGPVSLFALRFHAEF